MRAALSPVRSRVFTEAAEGEALTWMRQLEEEEAISPLWEVFFQLSAYPVPQVSHFPLTLAYPCL